MTAKIDFSKMHDGDWWLAKDKEVQQVCRFCGKRFMDVPAIMWYRPELDRFKDQTEKHPGWDKTGWLAYWQCTYCDNIWYQVVTEKQVLAWGKPNEWVEM